MLVWKVTKKVWHDLGRHDVSGQAMQLAFSHLFSIFPFLICLSALIGIFGQRTDLIPWVMERLERYLPADALPVIEETFQGISRGYAPQVLTAGFVVLIYFVSCTYLRLMRNLSVTFDSPRKRNVVWANVLAFIMSLVSLASVIVAFNLVLIGRHWMDALLEAAEIKGFWGFFGKYLRYPFAAVLIFLVVLLVYRVCPVRKIRLRHLWLGAAFFTVVWVGMTRGFGIYLAHFNRYNRVYGTLGGLIILMVWLYMTGYVLLLGAEIAAAFHDVRSERKVATA
jgi:membrane protein